MTARKHGVLISDLESPQHRAAMATLAETRRRMDLEKMSTIAFNMKEFPPGSPKARDAGCRCPIIDNCHGRGCGRTDDKGEPLFWTSELCKLHWGKPSTTTEEELR